MAYTKGFGQVLGQVLGQALNLGPTANRPLNQSRETERVTHLELEEAHPLLEAASLIGITAGLALMLAAFFVGELGFLAVPAFAVLVPSLLYGSR